MSNTNSAAIPGGTSAAQGICVDPSMSIVGASQLMRNYQVEELVVTDQNDVKVAVGIVSARDIVTRIIAMELDPVVLTAGDLVGINRCTGHE